MKKLKIINEPAIANYLIKFLNRKTDFKKARKLMKNILIIT